MGKREERRRRKLYTIKMAKLWISQKPRIRVGYYGSGSGLSRACRMYFTQRFSHSGSGSGSGSGSFRFEFGFGVQVRVGSRSRVRVRVRVRL